MSGSFSHSWNSLHLGTNAFPYVLRYWFGCLPFSCSTISWFLTYPSFVPLLNSTNRVCGEEYVYTRQNLLLCQFTWHMTVSFLHWGLIKRSTCFCAVFYSAHHSIHGLKYVFYSYMIFNDTLIRHPEVWILAKNLQCKLMLMPTIHLVVQFR